MTVGLFKKFVSMFVLSDTLIKYFDSKYMGASFVEELDPEDIYDNYIVNAYLMLLENNEVHVFVEAV